MSTLLACGKCGQQFPGTPTGEFEVCPGCDSPVDHTGHPSKAPPHPDSISDCPTRCEKCKEELGSEWQCWDSRAYCMKCVRNSGLDEFDPETDELRETVCFTWLMTLIRALWCGIYMTTLMAALITGVFAVLALAYMIASVISGHNINGLAIIDDALLCFGMFFGFSWIFSSIVCFPVMFVLTVAGSRRSLSVRKGQLIVELPFVDRCFELSKCNWMSPPVTTDNYGPYLPWLKPSLAVGMGSLTIGMGFDERSQRLWTGYLKLAGIEQKHPDSTVAKKLVLAVPLGFVFGCCLGAFVGLLPFAITGDLEWLTVPIFLGMTQGPVLSGWYVMATTPSEKQNDWLKCKLGMVFLTCVLLGMKAASGMGMFKVITLGVVNGILGVIAVSLVIGPLVRRHHQSDDCADPVSTHGVSQGQSEPCDTLA